MMTETPTEPSVDHCVNCGAIVDDLVECEGGCMDAMCPDCLTILSAGTYCADCLPENEPDTPSLEDGEGEGPNHPPARPP